MKVLSDIYTYSKDKSSVVFHAGSNNESSKQKKTMVESSWFSKNWVSTPTLSTSTSWVNKMSLPKYKMPKYSFPKYSFPKYSFPKISFPQISFPKMSFPKMSFPTAWFKSLLVKLEETKVNCYIYLVELFQMLKQQSSKYLSCKYLNYPSLQFNSNPQYVDYPWYKRAFFTMRDNVYGYIELSKESVKHIAHREEEIKKETIVKEEREDDQYEGFENKGSKSKVDEERTTRGNIVDDKYNMKHSQSSKYSNDLNTLRSSKKLKKTNTDDLKNEEANTTPKSNKVFSMFSKSDVDSKSPKISSPINKSGSLYVDANEETNIETEENKNVSKVSGEESIPGSNDTSEEKTKFNIKKTWDKFSKIIS